MTTAVIEAITTIAEAENLFDLSRTEEEAFFPEWQTSLSDLSSTEQANLDELRERYIYQRSEGQLLEGTVTLLLASPLLATAGFYNPPFKVRAEASVQLVLKDSEETLQGRIDVLVLKNQLWVVVLESKKTALSAWAALPLSAWAALPQALAYVMANPQPELPSFGMVTNGDDIIFVKLSGQPQRQYVLSRAFSPLVSKQELYSTLKILKRIGETIR